MTYSTEHFASFDGARLAIHTEGEGRPVILLHGLFSSAQMNWIKWGHGARLAAAGFRAIMLDFRVHGDSDAPQDAAAYPPGVLVRDVAALAEHLGLEPRGFDLVGFSLGARTAIFAGITVSFHVLFACASASSSIDQANSTSSTATISAPRIATCP